MKTGDVHALAHHLQGYAYKWEEIGLALGFLPDELQNIKYSALTLAERFEEVLHLWSQWPNGCHLQAPTKERLVGALVQVEHSEVGGCIDKWVTTKCDHLIIMPYCGELVSIHTVFMSSIVLCRLVVRVHCQSHCTKQYSVVQCRVFLPQSMHFPIVWCAVYIHFAACSLTTNLQSTIQQ